MCTDDADGGRSQCALVPTFDHVALFAKCFGELCLGELGVCLCIQVWETSHQVPPQMLTVPMHSSRKQRSSAVANTRKMLLESLLGCSTSFAHVHPALTGVCPIALVELNNVCAPHTGVLPIDGVAPATELGRKCLLLPPRFIGRGASESLSQIRTKANHMTFRPLWPGPSLYAFELLLMGLDSDTHEKIWKIRMSPRNNVIEFDNDDRRSAIDFIDGRGPHCGS